MGFGSTFPEALAEMKELTLAQVRFAIFKKQPELIFHPAPIHIIEMFTFLVAQMLQHLPDSRFPVDRVIQGFDLPIPEGPIPEYAQAGG